MQISLPIQLPYLNLSIALCIISINDIVTRITMEYAMIPAIKRKLISPFTTAMMINAMRENRYAPSISAFKEGGAS